MSGIKEKPIYKVIWSVLSVIIAICAIYAVMSQARDFSFSNLLELIRSGNKFYLVITFLCIPAYIIAEGEAIRVIVRKLHDKKITFGQSFVYSAADIYFSAITPSATGGQPASVYFMMKDKIGVSVISASLVLNLFMYNMAIVFIGLICFIFNFDTFLSYNLSGRVMIVLGYAVLIGLMIGTLLLLKKGDWVHKIGQKFIGLLAKMHIVRNKEAKLQKLEGTIERYKDSSDALFKDKPLLIKVFLINLFQRSIQIAVPSFMFLAMNGSPKFFGNIWVVQAYSVLGSNWFPIPGAMGVVDYLMLTGYSAVMERDMAVNLELAGRSVSFYICIVVSLIAVVIGYLTRRRKERAGRI